MLMYSMNSYCAELDETEAPIEHREARFQDSHLPKPVARIRIDDWEQIAGISAHNPRSFPPSAELTVGSQTKVFSLPRGEKQFMSEFAGQLFSLDIEDGSIILTHPRWSLVGLGPTLGSAELDLAEQARDALEALGFFPISEFSLDELEYRDFLLSVI